MLSERLSPPSSIIYLLIVRHVYNVAKKSYDHLTARQETFGGGLPLPASASCDPSIPWRSPIQILARAEPV